MMRANLLALMFVVTLSLVADANGQSGQYSSSSACNSCNVHNTRNSPTFFQRYWSAYDWNVVWPGPFIPPARNGVTAMYEAMANNGWQRQNLLGMHHFHEETNELTQAGRLKVQWILTQTPMNRRNIFVQRAGTAELTAQRIESIRTFTDSMSPSPGMANITDTHLVAEGHSAGMVDAVFTGFRENQPAPILPPAETGTENSN